MIARYYELLGHIECEEGKGESAELRLKEMEALIPKVKVDEQQHESGSPEIPERGYCGPR